MQPDDAVTVAAEHDVAAISGHCRAHARVEQLLDLIDDFRVLGADVLLEQVVGIALQHRAAGDEMLHDGAEHLGASASATRSRPIW